MDSRGADLAAYSCNLELLVVVPPPCIESFSTSPPQKIYILFFVTHINGTISLKKLQSQIIHCNPPFEDPNASNWAFMTYKLYLPLPLSLFFSFSPLAFVFLPSRHAAEWHWASPCRGALLSHSSAHFSLSPLSSRPPSFPPPPDNELLTEYIIWAVVLFVVVLATKKKRWIINDDRQKRKEESLKKKKKENLVFLGIAAECLRLHQEACKDC